jgi:hypothetical protein
VRHLFSFRWYYSVKFSARNATFLEGCDCLFTSGSLNNASFHCQCQWNHSAVSYHSDLWHLISVRNYGEGHEEVFPSPSFLFQSTPSPRKFPGENSFIRKLLTNSMAYGTRRFVLAFRRTLQLLLFWINPHVNIYFCKIHSNIVLPSTPRPS